MVSNTSETGTPSASARSRSTSAYSCGALTRKLVLAAAIAGCSTAFATNSWATAANAEKSPPLGSCNWTEKPPVEPSPLIEGALKARIKGFRNFGKFLKGGCDQAGNLFGRMRALLPVLQGDEHRRLIGSPGIKNKVLAGKGIRRMDCRNRLEIAFQLTHDFNRPFQGGAIRQLDDRNEIALIFFRKKCSWNGFEQAEDDEYQCCEYRQSNR